MKRFSNSESGGWLGKIIGFFVLVALLQLALEYLAEHPVLFLIVLLLIVAAIVFAICKIIKAIKNRKKNKKSANAPEAETKPLETSNEAEKIPQIEEKETVVSKPAPMPHVSIRMSYQYEYENVGLYRPAGIESEMPEIGDEVFFMLDPTNEYDCDAVKAVSYQNGELVTVGYCNRNKIRDIITDFLNREDEIYAEVTGNDPKLKVWIGMTKRRD